MIDDDKTCGWLIACKLMIYLETLYFMVFTCFLLGTLSHLSTKLSSPKMEYDYLCGGRMGTQSLDY